MFYFVNDMMSGFLIRICYIIVLYFMFISFMSIGFGNVVLNMNVEKIFSIFVMLLGCKLYIILN